MSTDMSVETSFVNQLRTITTEFYVEQHRKEEEKKITEEREKKQAETDIIFFFENYVITWGDHRQNMLTFAKKGRGSCNIFEYAKFSTFWIDEENNHGILPHTYKRVGIRTYLIRDVVNSALFQNLLREWLKTFGNDKGTELDFWCWKPKYNLYVIEAIWDIKKVRNIRDSLFLVKQATSKTR